MAAILHSLLFGYIKLTGECCVFCDRAETVGFFFSCVNHCGSISIQQFRLEEHVATETQLANEVTIFQSPDASLKLIAKIRFLGCSAMGSRKVFVKLIDWS